MVEVVMNSSLAVEILDDAPCASPASPAQDFAAPAQATVASPKKAEPQSLRRLLVILENEKSCDLPPDDVLNLLIATALFARAVIQLDRDDSSRRRELQCYDALAALKLSLRRVAWSRDLE
jgi:hypothetical protein